MRLLTPSYDVGDIIKPIHDALSRTEVVRGALLRRVVVPDVPQGPRRRGRADDPANHWTGRDDCEGTQAKNPGMAGICCAGKRRMG